MNFNNILIGTDNAEAMVAYYTKLFGPPQFSEGGFSGWQFGEGCDQRAHDRRRR